ncbi:hypothetical protein D9M72_354860 [compost metagenome]
MLGIACLQLLPQEFNLLRRRVQRQRNARAGSIEQADRFVRQLPGRDVAMRQPDRGTHRLITHEHLVMRLERGNQPAQHGHCHGFFRLDDLQHLEPPRERGILFDMALVLRPGGGADGAQHAARQRWLEQVGGVAGARLPAGTDQRVYFVDKQDHRLGGPVRLLQHGLQACLEFPLHAGAGEQCPDIEAKQPDILQARRHLPRRNGAGESFDHGRLAYARIAGQQRVVLTAAQQDVRHGADLLLAADHGVELAGAGGLGQVKAVLAQR